MELKRALEIFEYNKAMLTCDMSISRDPERQDVSPDYYGKDAEDLYYAIVCVEKYIKSAIPIEWLNKKAEGIAFAYWTNARNKITLPLNELPLLIDQIIRDWEKENEK